MLHGLPRRSTAIAAGALLLTGALSSCGFDLATDQVNTISSGINDRDGDVDVLGAVVISGSPDTGTFVATLVNNTADEAIALTGVAGDASPVDDLAPQEVDPLDVVSLFQTGGVSLAGPIGLGDFIDVELSFDNGQTTSLSVPVVRPCYEYDPAKFPALDIPFSPAEPAHSDEEGDEEGDGEHSSADDSDPYSCTPIEPVPHGEGEE